jgi:hypothetical protein
MLTVDITNIKNWEELCLREIPKGEKKNLMRLQPDEDHCYNPVTESIIFLGMSCGFSEITQKNWQQVARRIQTYEGTFGPFLRNTDGRYLPITDEQVREHIGLRTNVSKLTEVQFNRGMGDRAVRELRAQWKTKIEDTNTNPMLTEMLPPVEKTAGLGERKDVDYEETYYRVQRELENVGHDVAKLDEALDSDEDGANELLERVHDGEDSVELATEYGYID